MRLKILLFVLLLWGGTSIAQDTIPQQDTINYLVITEARVDWTYYSYLELTNMGNEPVNLNQFKIGWWDGGATLDYETGKTDSEDYFIPVNHMLPPGESYVFASIAEYGPKKYAQGLEGFPEKQTQDNMWELADFYVYLEEPRDDGTDIVTEGLYIPFGRQFGPGMNGFYIEQHFPNGDSMVVDQVCGMFTGEGGVQPNRTEGVGFDIAGMANGTGEAYLIRRFSVKDGTLDFNNARGIGLDESEWIPIPIQGGPFRLAPWTVGNHGNYNLDANTLESDIIEVDFANRSLIVPWGVRRGDDIMRYFKQKPGIGWEYQLSPVKEDSLSHAAHTGDRLIIYVCGNNLDKDSFDIVVKEPAMDANIVVPVSNWDPQGSWRYRIEEGYMGWPRVTQHESGNDTIWGARGGIPYATRLDSLLERLEKPSNAQWEIVYADGLEKPDLAHGDKLKITAEDGSVKEYFISVLDYRASDNAYLSSITWPDIPDFYKGILGWIGDTIPGFGPTVYNYNIQVPLTVNSIPALVAKSEDLNAKIEVNRATSLRGTTENRTVTYTVTSESDTTVNEYSVQLTKEKLPENIQPYQAEPFISEYIYGDQWRLNCFVEICNPGTVPLDLSNYLIAGDWGNSPPDIIQKDRADSWNRRYQKYIPGYKWQREAEWNMQPYLAQYDLAVNAIVQPGDVFCLGTIQDDNATCEDLSPWVWPALTELDVQFLNSQSACRVYENPWGEEVHDKGTPVSQSIGASIYLFKIINDSVKQGLKPATDPTDFELIDVMGTGGNGNMNPGGKPLSRPSTCIRKPEIFEGNPAYSGSFGETEEESEWTVINRNTLRAQGFSMPMQILAVNNDLGKHYFIPPTHYMSTVSSVVYKVSEGYSMNEQIRGMTTGTTVSDFLGYIIKADEGQTLTVTAEADGSKLQMDAALSMNDTLTVLSADSTRISKYILEVSEEGLSSNALLTSDRYIVSVNEQPKSTENDHTDGSGTVSGFEYGTQLITVLENVTLPAGASLSVIDSKGAYIPMKKLNYDTAYINVTVNSDTYFDVLAEDGLTRITYQLIPEASASSAFVTSDMYSVIQRDLLIQFVPRGINVQSFLSDLVPSLGASLKLVDKFGFERMDGTIADDDKVVVTSANGSVSIVYHISRLPNRFVPETTYLAYILSNIYTIDQVINEIYGVSGTTGINEFYSRIRAAEGATAIIVDGNGMEKTTGDIDRTDKVKVISADGKIEVYYTFGQLVGSEIVHSGQIEIYPNPTSGMLNVTGVEKGNRIQVFNTVGSTVADVQVESNSEIIKLNGEPAGLYLIVISNRERLLGRYKAVKY